MTIAQTAERILKQNARPMTTREIASKVEPEDFEKYRHTLSSTMTRNPHLFLHVGGGKWTLQAYRDFDPLPADLNDLRCPGCGARYRDLKRHIKQSRACQFEINYLAGEGNSKAVQIREAIA